MLKPALTPINLPSIIPEIKVSEEAKQKIRLVLDSGVAIDQFGLITPRIDRQILDKFCPDILKIRTIIIDQLRLNKHILYLPGSYDLTHVGHASFIQEAVENYCKDHVLNRKDLFVVALADDDELIASLKNNPSRNEAMPRPIQSLELMGHLCGDVSPRLMDLASLPDIDLVGILPSPPAFGSIVRQNVFQNWLQVAKQNWHILVQSGKAPEEFRQAFGSMLDNLNLSTYGEVSTAYKRAKHLIADSAEHKVKWRIQDWHFMLHQFIGDVDFSSKQTNFKRVISVRDSYAEDVERCMSSCGIMAYMINDTSVISTSDLIKQYGWERLKNQKLSYLVNLANQGLIPFNP